MLIASGHRFHPRSAQERERDRRDSAVRAQVAALVDQVNALDKEQRVQFRRIADIQAKLDEVLRVLKKSAGVIE